MRHLLLAGAAVLALASPASAAQWWAISKASLSCIVAPGSPATAAHQLDGYIKSDDDGQVIVVGNLDGMTRTFAFYRNKEACERYVAIWKEHDASYD
jgi:hypothetical protein